MSSKKTKIERLRNLAELRESGRDRIAKDVGFLKESLKPDNLIERARKSGTMKAEEIKDQAIKTAKANPAGIAAVGGLVTLAILYNPVRRILSNRNKPVNTETEYATDDEE